MLQLIKAIQNAKTALAAGQRSSSEQRSRWIDGISRQLSLRKEEILLIESQSVAAEREFIEEWTYVAALALCEAVSEELRSTSHAQSICRPTGLLSIFLPEVLPMRALLERVVPGLAAGNAMIIKASVEVAKLFQQIMNAAEIPEFWVQFVHHQDGEVDAMMAQHPAVNAISFAGRSSRADALLKLSALAHKKIQFSLSTNNSAILLGEKWTAEQIQILADSCVQGGGLLPWNMTKVFVLEKAIGNFLEQFLPLVREQNVRMASAPRTLELQAKTDLLVKEGGKLVCGGRAQGDFFEFTVIQDLSHCSVAHQDEMRGPVVLLSPVKYVHDAVKWSNTGSLSAVTLILGDPEAAVRIADKLESGLVLINRCLRGSDGTVFGGQHSSLGFKNFHVFGDFFSNCKKIGAS